MFFFLFYFPFSQVSFMIIIRLLPILQFSPIFNVGTNNVHQETPMLHLRLLLFAFQTALTTAICIVEYNSWSELSTAEKSSLGGLYTPYFIFCESKPLIFRKLLLWGRRGRAKIEKMNTENSADMDSISCGHVCRHVYEGQSRIDDCWGNFA